MPTRAYACTPTSSRPAGDHPLFDEARDKGLLIADGDGEPDWVQFWDAVGAYLDFTNPRRSTWWKEKVTGPLCSIAAWQATWNDNNEFEIVIPGPDARLRPTSWPAIEMKPLQTLLMMRASREAQIAHAPDKRPFLVPRRRGRHAALRPDLVRRQFHQLGDAALQHRRWVWAWRFPASPTPATTSAAFDGPKPDAELFVRWVGFGVFMPRFSIHSWNDDGTANEPWMHPECNARGPRSHQAALPTDPLSSTS